MKLRRITEGNTNENVAILCSGITVHLVRSKPDDIKVFGSIKFKGHKHGSQNRIRSYKLEGGEP